MERVCHQLEQNSVQGRGDDPEGLYWGSGVGKGLGVERGVGGKPGTRERPKWVTPRRPSATEWLHRYPASSPPSTGRATPVILPAAGELRNTAARPISSGVEQRRVGV